MPAWRPTTRVLMLAGFALCALAPRVLLAQDARPSPAGPTSASLDAPPESASPPAPASEEPAADAAYAQALSERLLKQDGKATARAKEDRMALVMFYGQRKDAPLWTTAQGLSPAGEALMGELAAADDWGLDAAAFKINGLDRGATFTAPAEQAAAEFDLSTMALKYARHAHGGRADPGQLSRNIDRQLTFVEPQTVLADLAKSSDAGATLRGLHPRHPQFELLRQKMLALRRGEKLAVVAPPKDEGAADKAKSEPAKPEKASLKKLLLNMEQWRWMPEDLGDYHVTVNVPEFTLRVVKDGRVILAERAVVGKPDKQTPIFSEGMAQVIFNPTWGVPDSIKKADILPSLAKGRMRILARYNLKLTQGGKEIDPETVDWSTADIRRYNVIQPSGGENVLGVVKFRFPNKHDVYMHDTPTKKLFNATDRAYSHGCIRVREPEKFAEFLLSQDQGWTAARVAAAVKSGQENQTVNLKRKIPVHLTYFTATVGEDGKLRLFRDVYGHEPRIALGMEGKAHLISKEKEDTGPAKVDVVGSLAESKSPSIGHKDDWARRAFGAN